MKSTVIIAVLHLALLTRGEDAICKRSFFGYSVCTTADTITKITPSRDTNVLYVELKTDTIIGSNAFSGLNISDLRLEFSKTKPPYRSLELQRESFAGLWNLTSLKIVAANLKLDGNPLESLGHLKTLILSHGDVTEVPTDQLRWLPNLQELGFSNNLIRVIHPGAFSCLRNLRTLFLDSNRITSLQPGCFDGLDQLETLDLSDNSLTAVPDVFGGLDKLTHLHLKFNEDLAAVESGALRELPSLTHLSLSHTKFTSMSALSDLHELTHLDASRANLQKIPREAFSNLTLLKFLDISGNHIDTIEVDALAGLNLTTLEISESKTSGFLRPGVFDSAIVNELSLSDSDVRRIVRNIFNNRSMQTLRLSWNSISDIEAGAFSGLNVTILDLSFNKELTYLNSGVFDNLTVDNLKLNDNGIGKIAVNVFNYLRTLRSLDLSSNRIAVIEAGAFSGLNLTKLDLSNNLKLSSLNGEILAGVTMEKLKLQRNNISAVRRNILNGLKGLRYLDLSANHIGIIEEGALAGLNLDTLDLSNNPELQVISAGMFSGLTVEDLMLKDCRIFELKSFIFSGMTVRLVDLEANQLEHIGADDFSGLITRDLDLSHNKIGKIAPDAFKNTTIQSIDLAYNPISSETLENKRKWGLLNTTKFETIWTRSYC